MKGWHRIHGRAVYHLFITWAANNFMLTPVCRRPIFLAAKDGRHLVLRRIDLPLDAKLCRACTAMPEAREAA